MARRPLLIEVVARRTTAEAIDAYRDPHPATDLVEFRLDGIVDLKLDRILEARGRPKLLTVRSRAQGGAAGPEDRAALLRRLLRSGAEYVDLESGDVGARDLFRPGGPKRVLSWHDPHGTPIDLEERAARLLAVPGVDLVKVVTWAEVTGDNLRYRDLLRAAPRGRLIAFAMGPKGVPSRILAAAWGSAALFAPRSGAPASAAGQIPIEDLEEVYRWRGIAPTTTLLGVLGAPVGGSMSPRLHNAGLEALGLDMRYLPFEASSVAEFLPVLSDLRLRGLSVTHPFKEAILPHLDGLDADARACGAVNTVVKVWNRLEGRNTDLEASVAPLRGWLRLRGARVGVLGAGGAARALALALRRRGARVTVFSRTPERGRALARATGVLARGWAGARGFRGDLVVNATPVGMTPRPARTPIPATWLKTPRYYALIYNPIETLLMRRAQAIGLEARGGLEMFVAQGAAQFSEFTGREAPIAAMRRAVTRALEASAPPSRRAATGAKERHADR
ncbi:MAG TPA: type I 3-dehydroquinate dehydratase [Dongiaceae bacterium]|nr:type I 3-dehydroquinate dehydratase [Dongiaceae bacterium]